MSSKGRFGGMELGAIVQSSQSEASAKAGHKAQVPIGELAMKGASIVPVPHERQTISLADPRRCRPWKFHNRHPTWYTRERCGDLIEAIGKGEQLEPALGRRLEGDPNYDFELIYGMRRRFACEVLNRPLKVRVSTIADKEAAVVMHQENYDRQDITKMERAIAYTRQLRGGLFKNQEEIATALNVSKATVSQMVACAEFIENPDIAVLFPAPPLVPLKGAYAVSVLMNDKSNPANRVAIERKAKELASSDKLSSLTPAAVLKLLEGACKEAKPTTPFKRAYNVGASKRMIVTRNLRGKVTFAFTEGLSADMEAEVVNALKAALNDL